MVESINGAVIATTHLAAQLEWLSHAVKGFGFDFPFAMPPGGAAKRRTKPKSVGYNKLQLTI
ncbi:MAG: hypothetical protein OEL78_02880 [Hyphomicrobiales bacterium]|nr:hypothetical protein [Hyphomicrobiales bacterium]